MNYRKRAAKEHQQYLRWLIYGIGERPPARFRIAQNEGMRPADDKCQDDPRGSIND